MGKILLILTALLPSSVRVPLLRWRGANIGRGVKIGIFTLLDSEEIDLGDHVYIASFNLVHRLGALKMGSGSRINGFNWITGARIGSLYLGAQSAITRFHFFEASGNIQIGENTIVAGRGSQFYTHGISSSDLDVVRGILISDWCYVGSGCKFVPGSSVGRGSFVGMGAVVTKTWVDEYVVLGGGPAKIVKKLPKDSLYFTRTHLPHEHHPQDYKS